MHGLIQPVSIFIAWHILLRLRERDETKKGPYTNGIQPLFKDILLINILDFVPGWIRYYIFPVGE